MAQFCQRQRESDSRADYWSLISRPRTEPLCRGSQEAPKGEIPVTYYGIEEVIKSSFGLSKTSDTTTQKHNEDLVYMCKYIHFVLVFQKKCHNYLWKTRAVWLHVLVGRAFLQLDTFCQCLEHVETGTLKNKTSCARSVHGSLTMLTAFHTVSVAWPFARNSILLPSQNTLMGVFKSLLCFINYLLLYTI